MEPSKFVSHRARMSGKIDSMKRKFTFDKIRKKTSNICKDNLFFLYWPLCITAEENIVAVDLPVQLVGTLLDRT